MRFSSSELKLTYKGTITYTVARVLPCIILPHPLLRSSQLQKLSKGFGKRRLDASGRLTDYARRQAQQAQKTVHEEGKVMQAIVARLPVLAECASGDWVLRSFTSRLQTALPPVADWPSDVSVPFADITCKVCKKQLPERKVQGRRKHHYD
eukprot:5276819-Amphidinium_carterae.2